MHIFLGKLRMSFTDSSLISWVLQCCYCFCYSPDIFSLSLSITVLMPRGSTYKKNERQKKQMRLLTDIVRCSLHKPACTDSNQSSKVLLAAKVLMVKLTMQGRNNTGTDRNTTEQVVVG